MCVMGSLGARRGADDDELVISLAKIRSASGAAESGLVSTCCCHRERVQNQQVRHLQTEVSALSFPLFFVQPFDRPKRFVFRGYVSIGTVISSVRTGFFFISKVAFLCPIGKKRPRKFHLFLPSWRNYCQSGASSWSAAKSLRQNRSGDERKSKAESR